MAILFSGPIKRCTGGESERQVHQLFLPQAKAVRRTRSVVVVVVFLFQKKTFKNFSSANKRMKNAHGVKHTSHFQEYIERHREPLECFAM